MLVELRRHIGAGRIHLEALLAGIRHQGFDQPCGNAAPADLGRDDGVFGDAHAVALDPGQAAKRMAAGDMGVIGSLVAVVALADGYVGHEFSAKLDGPVASRNADMAMLFQSDNAASVHPAVWRAMQAADAPDLSYDGDALSARLDEAFIALFGQDCAALWVATGTAANCLALASMVPPEGGVVCHREAHIEGDECGAPGFFLHGAKLMPAEGEGARLTPEGIAAVIDPIPDDVHRVQPRAVSITQASELGRVYSPDELRDLSAYVRGKGLALHVDGARFANAVAHLNCTPAEACAGADALSFGCVKNGGMGAEAIVFFDPAAADVIRYRRKRAGHLQSKGRFMAAQILALLEDGLWLENARAANAAAQEIAQAAQGRLLQPVEANEVFLTLAPAECAALRAQGFGFYERKGGARIVTSWNSRPEHVSALARAIAAL